MAMRRVIFALLGWAAWAAPAQADDITRVVAENGVLKNQFYLSLNPDCTLMDYPVVKITTSPANGELFLSKGAAYPNFAASNPRSACNTKRSPAMIVEYRPNQGFTGSDSFTLDVIFPSGGERTDNYNITVK
jgi:hypothetical protein